MSIVEIPPRRLIRNGHYQESLAASLDLFQKETLSIEQRRQMIKQLLDRGTEGEDVGLIARLLLSDPLSDQQAGAVARCFRLVENPDLLRLGLGEKGRDLHFDPDEIVEIMVGDWEQINRIFFRFPRRANHWRKSLRGIETSKAPKTVYRMLELHPDDIAPIRQFGMIPEGLLRHISLQTVIAAHQLQLLDQGHPPHSLFFSKVNLLVENWAEWKSAIPSPFKLGLAVTTAKNIRHRDFGFFGSYIFEIVLPADRLVAAPKDDLPEDERTVFYHIEPEAIRAVYQIEPISPHTTWEQIQIQKAKSSLTRLLGR